MQRGELLDHVDCKGCAQESQATISCRLTLIKNHNRTYHVRPSLGQPVPVLLRRHELRMSRFCHRTRLAKPSRPRAVAQGDPADAACVTGTHGSLLFEGDTQVAVGRAGP